MARGFGGAAALLTATSLLVPLVGLATAPILTQSLGAPGRGEVAAAIAPNILIASVATLGLPEALTFHLARNPHASRRLLAWSALITSGLGVLCIAAALALTDVLAGDSPNLGALLTIGTLLALPTLPVNLLRGAAIGRQMWNAVAMERVANSVLRLVALAVLALAGQLDEFSALLVIALAPIVAGASYWRLLRSPTRLVGEATAVGVRSLMRFGTRTWVGSVSSIITARLPQLLVVPLSDARQLGLFVVAITVADVPFIVSTAVRDVLFGVDSREQNAERIAMTSRLASLLCLFGCVVLGATLPLWIAPVFGADFEPALSATWLMLAATASNVPGWMAGAGLGAWGRPALRSVGPGITVVVTIVGVVALVPTLGADGAAAAALAGGLLATVYTLIVVSRVIDIPIAHFIIPRRSDVEILRAAVVRFRQKRRGSSN